MSKKVILITGSHRSGTTWTGKVLTQSGLVNYIQEPFNLVNEHYNFLFDNQFINVAFESVQTQEEVKNYLKSFYSVFHQEHIKEAIKIRSINHLKSYIKETLKKVTKRPLLKDPLALMSAEWIYRNFNADVVMLIRHPSAFVASLKVKDWHFNFNYFLNQEDFLHSDLSDYKEEIIEYSKNKKDKVSQGVLLWNILYSVVLKYQVKYDEQWYFVKHEDLSLNPMMEFE